MLHPLDWLVIVVYCLVVLGLGMRAGREEKNEEDYFLGGRSIPWWAAGISFLATTASALTFVAVPGTAFKGDFVYLQLAGGDLLGRYLIGAYLLPAYFAHRVTTVYQLLGKRFGSVSQDAGTVLFLVTRVLASSVRLTACGIAFSVIFGMPLDATIVAITLVAMVYTVAGGIKAVIWTDFLQFLIFIGGAILALGTIVSALPEGVSTFLEIGSAHQKFRILHLEGGWNNPDNLVPGTIFGLLLTFAVQGTDQDLVQRLLTTRTCKDSQKAMLWTALATVPMNLIFLGVGAGLFAYYQVNPDPAVTKFVAEGHTDWIFPHFMKTVLAPGVRGFLMVGILAAAMSSLDSTLNALASTAYIDLYRKHVSPEDTPEHAVRISRWFSVGFAVILAMVAMAFGNQDGILWVGFRIMGYTYGTLLGLFLLAVWTRDRGSDTGNLTAIVASISLVLVLTREWKSGPLVGYAVAWPWAIAIGVVSTVAIGSLWKTPRHVLAAFEKERNALEAEG